VGHGRGPAAGSRTYQHDGSRGNGESRIGRSLDTADDGVGVAVPKVTDYQVEAVHALVTAVTAK